MKTLINFTKLNNYFLLEFVSKICEIFCLILECYKLFGLILECYKIFGLILECYKIFGLILKSNMK